MATIKFLTKGNKSPLTIYLRLRDGRSVDITISTGITIAPNHWSKTKHWISHRADFSDKLIIENDLRRLESLVHSERNKAISIGNEINKKWLEKVILLWKGSEPKEDSPGLIDQIETYTRTLPNKVRNGKKSVSPGTIRNYNTTISRLKKFESENSIRLELNGIDLSFHDDYMQYGTNVLGLALNSIGKDIRNIKTVCLDAKDRGLEVNPQLSSRKFSAPSEKTIFTTLNEEDLVKIKQFEGPDYLENARDWLLIGCWTGCRVGDLMSLSIDNIIKHENNVNIIQYEQRKTGKLVNVPIHTDVQDILDRLEGFPRPISPEKFNKYIKEVSKRSGLTYLVNGTRQNPKTHRKEVGMFEKWELVRSHTCRRSFATNHYNKLPNKLIMAVTGHASEKMLLNYIGETEVDHIDDYLSLWQKT